MKNKLVLLGIILLMIGCKDKTGKSDDNKEIYGVWQRDFDPMPNATHHVEYNIDKDSVAYAIHGAAVNLDYKLAIDTIIDNKIISHSKNQYFVMFAEPHKDSIEIFKESKETFNDALDFTLPPKDYKNNHNQGWNMYYKK